MYVDARDEPRSGGRPARTYRRCGRLQVKRDSSVRGRLGPSARGGGELAQSVAWPVAVRKIRSQPSRDESRFVRQLGKETTGGGELVTHDCLVAAIERAERSRQVHAAVCASDQVVSVRRFESGGQARGDAVEGLEVRTLVAATR
jgi:hypothetical protein